MSALEQKLKCPDCAFEFTFAVSDEKAAITCPRCENEIPREILRDAFEVAEEIAPGFKPGQRIGNYVIESLIGTGGMAVVFKGKQLSLNRYVALKILPKEYVKKRLFVDRFESEGSVLASLNHPNIVSVIDRGVESETYYIVMEYIEGETLKDRLLRMKNLPQDHVCEIAAQVLDGLNYAHKRGVIHRDIKPGNIMINRDEIVKLADFGLAHLAKAQGGLDVTRDNQAMGTLKYMAPEQLTSAKRVDGRADLYSFGVVLYELLTGRLPLGMFKMPSEWDSTLDSRWDDVILRALKMEPKERFSSAEEMRKFIAEIVSTPKVAAKDIEKEDIQIRVEPEEASLTGCASCGSENSADSRKCEKCGASLDDMFQKCPGCGESHRIDVDKCPDCGADLAGYREKLRRKAESIQLSAKKLIADHKLDEAISQLRLLKNFTTREFASVRNNAQGLIDRLKQKRDRTTQRAYEAGQRFLAEGMPNQALKLWEGLPENYRDVAALRNHVLSMREQAIAAAADGSRMWKTKDVPGAVAAWEKAARFFPHDQEVRKRLEAARIALGNLKMKNALLKEAEDHAARGNVTDAIDVARRAVQMDPSDLTASAVLERLQTQDSGVKTPVSSKHQVAVRVNLPNQKRVLQIALISAGGLVLAVLFAVLIPSYFKGKEKAASVLYARAEQLFSEGNLQEANALVEQIQKKYGGTLYLQKAGQLQEEITARNAAAQSLCSAADREIKDDTDSILEGFRKYVKLVESKEILGVRAYYDYSLHRLDNLRTACKKLVLARVDEMERQGRLDKAVADYAVLANELSIADPDMLSRKKSAEEKLAAAVSYFAAAQDAAGGKEWQKANELVRSALNLFPANDEALTLLGQVTPYLPAPEGMVLVPAGNYRVGGWGGTPERTIANPVGFYIDVKEVSCADFSEFLKATGRATDTAIQFPNTDLPVVNITFDEAAAFARWKGKQLPTEEFFECAARGSAGSKYPWGNDWNPDASVFGLSPAPVHALTSDKSACGAIGLAGNVAEWTVSKPAIPPTNNFNPEDFRVVKGSSWIGLESQRPTIPILADANAQNPYTILLPLPDMPEVAVQFPSNIEIRYLGIFGAGDAYIALRKWLPEWGQWAEVKTMIAKGAAVSATCDLFYEEDRRRHDQIKIETGCRLVKIDRLYIEITDASGIIHKFFAEGNRGTVRNVLHQRREPLVSSVGNLSSAAESAARMYGSSASRYLNVGFRCVQPVWQPPQ